MTPDLLEELLEQIRGKDEENRDIAEELCDELDIIKAIKKQKAIIFSSLFDEEMKYKKIKANLEQQLRELEESCPHYSSMVVYYGDPSGGRDSFHECKLCGKQW